MSHPAPRAAPRVIAVLGLTSPPAAALVALLLLADLALFVLYLGHAVLGVPPNPEFDIGVDRAYSEFFQYVLVLWAAALALWLAVAERVGVLAVWAMACALLFADDWFRLHDLAGSWFAGRFPALGGADEVGQLLWFGGVGALVLVVVWAAHRRASPVWRSVSGVLLVLFALVVAVGIGFDLVHDLLPDVAALDAPLTLLEDGGELVVMCFVVAFLFAVAATGHRPVLAGRYARLMGVRPQDEPSPAPAD